MIPVKPQPQPASFHEKVRVPGQKYLLKTPKPTTNQWSSHAYWTKALYELWEAYNGICAYSGHWISPGTGSSTVEHFIPKSVKPELAYEWSNYRLICGLANGRKSDYQDVLDPFTIEDDWFFLDFPSLYIKPNPELPAQNQKLVRSTVERLGLNDDNSFVKMRYVWLNDYCRGIFPFNHLETRAPFTSYELRRQGLIESIKELWL